MRMPAPDQEAIARKEELVAGLETILPSANIISDEAKIIGKTPP